MRWASAVILVAFLAVPAPAGAHEAPMRALKIQHDQAQEGWAQAEGRLDALRNDLAKAREEIKKLTPKADEPPKP